MSNKKITFVVLVGLLLVGGVTLLFLWLQAPTQEPDVPSPSVLSRLPIIGSRFGATPTPASPETPGAGEGPGGLTGAEAQKLIPITEEPVIGPALDSKGEKILYYKKRDGHLVSNDLSGGKEETVSSLTILNMFDVRWASDKKYTAVRYEDAGVVKQFVMEATSSPKVTFFPAGATSLIWSPDGKTIFWLQRQNDISTLYSATADGSSQRRRTFSSPIPDLLLSFLTNNLFAAVSKSSFRYESPLFLYDLRTNTQTIPVASFGLRVKTDENAGTQTIAYTRTGRAGNLAELIVLDTATGKETPLGEQTIADKCVFSQDGKALICAVPQNAPDRGLPDEWLLGAVSLRDAFYRFDLGTGSGEKVMPETEYDAVNLVLSPDGKLLFFIDKKTGFLWRLSLD